MSFNNDPDTNIYNDLHKMEKLWAKELYELGVEDRETINDELHGVFVSKMQANQEEGWSEQDYSFFLNKFQIEIDTKILLADKVSYLEGLELGSSYITSSDFRLGFLRAMRFDVKKAAIRYCKCLDFLVELFGVDALLRPVRMSDLTKKERKFLRDGYIQILPSRDRVGRRIMAQLGSYGGTEYSQIERLRVCVYFCLAVLARDVSTQRLGVVSIASFTIEAQGFMSQELHTISRLIKQFFASVPLRWSAIHLCIPDDPVYHLLKRILLLIIGLTGRKLLRIHVGAPLECDYILRSFGIPTDDIPRTHTNTIKVKNHTRLIKVRKITEAFSEQYMATNLPKNVPFPIIECPEINCVLFGRYAWDHPGNIEFRGLLQEVMIAEKEGDLDMFDETHLIIKDVIEKSLSRKFRFLMYDRDTFLYREVTSYGDVWALVEQSVREHRKRSKAKRIMDETKLAIGKNIDKFTDGEVSNMSKSGLMGQQRNCGDCNGCDSPVFE